MSDACDVVIAPGGQDRIDALAALYSRAFLDDPIVRWPLPGTPDVQDRIREIFASIYVGIADDGSEIIYEGDAALGKPAVMDRPRTVEVARPSLPRASVSARTTRAPTRSEAPDGSGY